MALLSGLTLKQQRFADAYVGEAKGNATKAAQIAGYKGTNETLRYVGCENLTKPNILAYINTRIKPEMIKNRLTVDMVLDDLAWALEKAREQGKLREFLEACNQRGKYLGMFTERLQVAQEEIEAHEMSERRTQEARELGRLRLLKTG
jgi:phage terminase small subunit